MLKIVAGSYERILYGFDVVQTKDVQDVKEEEAQEVTEDEAQEVKEDEAQDIKDEEAQDGEPFSMEPTFIYPSHLSCIKALASTGRLLASGSTDENIKLYDIARNRELGNLMLQHGGSITHLEFYRRSTLFSASEDGTIGIYRTSDWEKLKSLSGHKGAVYSICIHPSGKLALSVGKDATIKCWDLARGLCARSSKLERPANQVFWSCGAPIEAPSSYVLVFDREIEIVLMDDQKTTAKISIKSRINYAVATMIGDKPVILAGCENGQILAYDGLDGTLLFDFDSMHASRVKAMDAYIAFPEIENAAATTYLVSCSSDGNIRLWHLSLEKGVKNAQLCSQFDTNCRLTCIIFAKPGKAVLKPKNPVDDEEATAVDLEPSDYEDEETLALYKKKNTGPTVSVLLEKDGETVSVSRPAKKLPEKRKRLLTGKKRQAKSNGKRQKVHAKKKAIGESQ